MSSKLLDLNVHVTTDSDSASETRSSFLSITTPLPQPLGPTASLSYVYSTPPSFTLADNADLTHYRATASSGPPYQFPGAGSSTLTYLDFGPNPGQEEGFWHRTQTVDYIVVLEGELELALDGGQKRVVKKGDVVVQRAPMHKWKNLSRTESASPTALKRPGMSYSGY
ncbi:hypothetical protein AK830_g2593 [Neonectria ditissima]|uniref:Cupin type-2 domain-containing protein n=1 Tax=Neonectria ditissima TaxID=78410 RepID=A0A0P7BJR1_9HYPO|nr:hypothetical protein AK830_g2593 [Neonectria ditissima]